MYENQNDEKRLTAQENLNRQNRDSLPQHPHQDEPAETRAEHSTEQAIGREIRPARREPIPAPRRPMPSVFQQERALPRHVMSMTVPNVTNAGRMMDKPAPRGMTASAPRAEGSFMTFTPPRVTAPRDSKMDPFKGLDNSSSSYSGDKKKRKLPRGMEFARKGRGWF